MTEQAAPLANRPREWVFCLYYAHLFSDRQVDRLVRDMRAVWAMADEEWESYQGLSPYVEDPRAGRVRAQVWAPIADEVRAFLSELVEHRAPVEQAIAKASPRWRVDRMPRVDRALLSLGTYELLWRRAAPAKRVINRTVELAKQYGEADTRRFVNGILDQIRRDHDIAPT